MGFKRATNKAIYDLTNFSFKLASLDEYQKNIKYGEQFYLYWTEVHDKKFVNFMPEIKYIDCNQIFGMKNQYWNSNTDEDDINWPIYQYWIESKTIQVLKQHSKLRLLMDGGIRKTFLLFRCFNNLPEYGVYAYEAQIVLPPEEFLETPDWGRIELEVRAIYYFDTMQDFMASILSSAMDGQNVSKLDIDFDFLKQVFPKSFTAKTNEQWIEEEEKRQKDKQEKSNKIQDLSEQIMDRMKGLY